MTTAVTLDGRTFGRLTVLGPAEPRRSPGGKLFRVERCVCECGTETLVYRCNLTSGKSTSCGCLTRERSSEAHKALRRSCVTYQRVHSRLNEDRGAASAYLCACGRRAGEWAYDHCDPNALRSPTGLLYSLDLTRYVPMCRPCHRRLDRRERDRRG